ncbi:MAG: hypothetical protein MZV70_29670 [Desulfobacterales bacterium]|nr:hypothetical protein [Desulfobacterales bacterium]
MPQRIAHQRQREPDQGQAHRNVQRIADVHQVRAYGHWSKASGSLHPPVVGQGRQQRSGAIGSVELTNSGRSANRVPAQSQLMWKQELGPSVVAAPHRGATRDESAASYRGNAEALQVRNHLKREQFCVGTGRRLTQAV